MGERIEIIQDKLQLLATLPELLEVTVDRLESIRAAELPDEFEMLIEVTVEMLGALESILAAELPDEEVGDSQS